MRMGLFEQPCVDEAGVLPLDRRRLRSVAIIGPLADSERDMLGSWVMPQNRPYAKTLLAGQDASIFDVWAGGDSAATLGTAFEVRE